MKHRVSTFVTYHDLEEYFRGGSWEFKRHDDGNLTAQSKVFDLKFFQNPTKYEVSITAVDDEADSKKDVTEDPVKFITKFLETGTEGDDVFKKMSSFPDPRLISFVLRRAATMLESGAMDLRGAAKMVRRAMVVAPGNDRILVAVVRAVAAAGDDESDIRKVTEDMKKKGWQVVQNTDERGNPVVEVDVSGIYTAEIKIKDSSWDYSFKVKGIDESEEHGQTNDPLQQFRVFYKKPSTDDFKKQLKEQKSQEPDPDATAAPKGKAQPKKEAPKTEPPPKKDRDEGSEDTQFDLTRLPPSSRADIKDWNQYS